MLPRFVHQLFDTQAARTPDALAVASPEERLTYRELHERAARLSRHLRGFGIGPERTVGVCLERSPDLVAAELAVLQAGAAYLPLDPAHPEERRRFIAADAALPLTIDRAFLAAIASAPAAGGAAPSLAVEHLAYVIYTSGSTGRPKGTELTHAGLRGLVDWHVQAYGLGPADRTTLLASPGFDAAVFETWPALATGASLHIPPAEVIAAPADLLAWLAAERITVCFLPTPLAEACFALELPPDLALRVVHAAGDRLHRVARRLPFRLFNLYGPTECTVATTAVEVETGGPGEDLPPIGRPLAGVHVHLVDPGVEPVAAGEAGEIVVAGACLARGYLRRPDWTAERFVPDPWAHEGPGTRLYRTGDLARELPSGDLDFVGRLDHQVKIRGFRIELGEVEAALWGCPGVGQAVAVTRPGAAGEPQLVAYVVADGAAGPPAAEDLRRRLLKTLPEPMVPSRFVFLETLPLSPQGKVDRRALPAPGERDGGESEPPRTAAEAALAAVWQEVLGIAQAGPGDSFLALGGHSLLAAQTVARVRDRLGVELSPRDLFEAPDLATLAAQLEERRGGAAPALPLVPVPRTGDLPLSFAQERVWFLRELDPQIRSYQAQAMIRFRGRLQVPVLRWSLGEIVRRHEIFRTTFPTVGDRPVQRFHPAWEVEPPVVDLSGLPAAAREGAAAQAVADECRRLFDPACLPLVRWTLLRLAPEEHVWLHVEHHLVHDGWSFNRLLEELMVLYAAGCRGEASPLAELPLQFADWAVWQRAWMRTPEAAAQIAWWKQTLSGRPAVLTLPTDHPRSRKQSFAGRVDRLELPASLGSALHAACRREGVSLYTLMQATFAALLARQAGQDQVNVGSAVANRRGQETEAIVGMIVDNVVLANDLSGDPTVRELLRRSWRLALETAARQDIPFDLVVEAVQPPRDPGCNPLFQASFSFHDSPLSGLTFPGLTAELTEGLSNGSAKFDLNAIGIPRDGRITLMWESATALFEAATMQRMIGHFLTLLAGFAGDPSRRVFELPLLTAAEEAQIAGWSGGGEVRPPAARSVQELVLDRARRTPDALAVAGDGRRLTYAELAALAGRIAHRLQRLGVGPETRVGLRLERSPELVAAALGVLAAGGAYLPLDPGHPEERTAWILDDAAVAVLITGDFLADLGEGEAAAPVATDPGNLAYVIYTSGSTGRPKGTELSQGGLLHLIDWHLGEYLRAAGLGPADRCTLLASPAFDASVWEIWPVLAAGASLHVPPEAIRAAPEALLAWMAAEKITVAFLPTPLAEACLELPLPPDLALRAVLTGGDRLHAVTRPLPFRLVNHYGPTECTVVATAGEVRAGEAALPSIGRPLAHLCARVLDPRGQPVPVGIPGQLYVGGAGLARGYLRRPGPTAAAFVPDPFGREPGARLYATGDLVRRRPDGALDFLGRIDHQVKIRGFRIELGEIEAVLAGHPAVRSAVVVVREGELGAQLAGYAVAGEEVTAGELRTFLEERLPAPMVPAAVAVLAELPLTPNGKVDRAALPEPDTAAGGGEGAVAPRTPVEELLQEIWTGLLGVEGIGVHDDFFRLGGHSLLGARMLARVRDALGVELPVSLVFDRPTLAGLAAAVEERFLAQAESLAGEVAP